MAFTIPKPIKVLPGGSTFSNLPALAFQNPREGRRYIPVEVDWDGAGTSYEVNVQGLTTQPFSQVVMLDVDNSQSGAEVTFYFADSQDTLAVPAGEGGLFPVFTGALTFYVAAPLAIASDVTRFRILNYRQEPVALPPFEAVTFAAASGFDQPATTALVASTVSGTLTGYSLTVSMTNPSAASGYWSGSLVSHTGGAIIDTFNLALGAVANTFFNGMVWDVNDIAVRFAGGIDLVVIGQPYGTGNVKGNVALKYRTP